MEHNNGNYTPNEVATLIEDLKSQFQFVIDLVSPLPNRIEGLEHKLISLESRVISVEDVLRVGFRRIDKRISTLEEKLGLKN